jgi:hypothetical protein
MAMRPLPCACAVLGSFVVCGAMSACAHEASAPSAHLEPAPIAVTIAPPEPEAPAGSSETARAPNPLRERPTWAAAQEKPVPWLPPAWSREQISPTMSFADAMREAREARRLLVALPAPRAKGDGGVADEATKAWFNRESALAERADRAYAAAFASTDATESERVDAIAEAAALVAQLAARLDDAGLGVLPRPWQSDALVHATFEDVDVGPTRRLRAAARALAARCVVEATAAYVGTPSADSCKRLAGEIPHHDTPRDAGSSACACDPGDPLCTGSAWCGP